MVKSQLLSVNSVGFYGFSMFFSLPGRWDSSSCNLGPHEISAPGKYLKQFESGDMQSEDIDSYQEFFLKCIDEARREMMRTFWRSFATKISTLGQVTSRWVDSRKLWIVYQFHCWNWQFTLENRPFAPPGWKFHRLQPWIFRTKLDVRFRDVTTWTA